jgi:hypothetical protein
VILDFPNQNERGTAELRKVQASIRILLQIVQPGKPAAVWHQQNCVEIRSGSTLRQLATTAELGEIK